MKRFVGASSLGASSAALIAKLSELFCQVLSWVDGGSGHDDILVLINDFNIPQSGRPWGPFKANPPPLIDPNAILPFAVTNSTSVTRPTPRRSSFSRAARSMPENA